MSTPEPLTADDETDKRPLWKRYQHLSSLIAGAVLAGLLYGLMQMRKDFSAEKATVPDRAAQWILDQAGWILLAAVVVLALRAWMDDSYSDSPVIEEGRERVRVAQRNLENVLEGEDRALALGRLWHLTHERLSLYHDIATGQARKSFMSAQRAMTAGFVLLVVFVVAAALADSVAVAAVAGGLGAVAAALAAFVSKTFVKSQETAAEHLRAYFNQPLEFSRYLAAERLLNDPRLSDEKRAEVIGTIAEIIANGPQGPLAEAGADFLGKFPQLLEGDQK
ncbi:hypothetical protein ACFQLX_08435 [Streptomyces polyrhachis]|uniref:Uncharacterized protein n=1 Tax=Streptomyces polyrhachis TaxID=1282885 RepID=A0ABW2GF65_9ACTN